jgi:hypothetical protein
LNPYFEKEDFEKLMDVMELAGELEKRAKYEDLVKNDIVNSVLKS